MFSIFIYKTNFDFSINGFLKVGEELEESIPVFLWEKHHSLYKPKFLLGLLVSEWSPKAEQMLMTASSRQFISASDNNSLCLTKSLYDKSFPTHRKCATNQAKEVRQNKVQTRNRQLCPSIVATVLRAPPVVNLGPCMQRKGTGDRALRALLSLQAPTGISRSFSTQAKRYPS